MGVRTTTTKRSSNGKTTVTATVDDDGGGGGSFEADVFLTFDVNKVNFPSGGVNINPQDGVAITDASTGLTMVTWSAQTVDDDGTDFSVILECKQRGSAIVEAWAMELPEGATSDKSSVTIECP